MDRFFISAQTPAQTTCRAGMRCRLGQTNFSLFPMQIDIDVCGEWLVAAKRIEISQPGYDKPATWWMIAPLVTEWIETRGSGNAANQRRRALFGECQRKEEKCTCTHTLQSPLSYHCLRSLLHRDTRWDKLIKAAAGRLNETLTHLLRSAQHADWMKSAGRTLFQQ